AVPMGAPATPRPRRAAGAPGAAQRGRGSSDSGSSSGRSRLGYGCRGPTVAAGATRVGAQPPEHPPVVTDRIVALRRLDNLNHRRETWVAHDASECLRADPPLADPLVAVEMRAAGALGVVQVQALEVIEPDLAIELLPYTLDRRGHLIPRGMQVRRVEAEPHPSPRLRGQRVAQRPQLLEPAPEAGSRARRPFDQHAHLARDGRQTVGVAARIAREPRRPVVDVVAGMRHDPWNRERSAPDQLAGERGNASLLQRRIR